MKKDTLQTIAARTGFSVSTVSRVLSGRARQYRISEKAIALIQQEAQACAYTPDLIAKGLRTRRTDTVGLTIPDISNPFFASLASSIITRLKLHGYNILLADTMETEGNEREALSSFISRKVDGIIAIPVGSSPEFLENICSSTPVVLLDRYYDETVLPYVRTDNYAGAYKATEYLINKGYRNILAIQGVKTSLPNRERVKGFLDAISQSRVEGLTGEVVGNAFSEANGYREMERVFNSGRKVDAIFTFSTTILMGAFTSLRQRGVSIPSDIAIISFDDNAFLDYMDPPISRVAQNTELLGNTAADMLVEFMEEYRAASEGSSAAGGAASAASLASAAGGAASAASLASATSAGGAASAASLASATSVGGVVSAAGGEAGAGAGFADVAATTEPLNRNKTVSIMPELILRSSC